MISLVCLFASCEKHQMHQQEDEGQDCVVSLNMVGEITVSEDELTRSTPSTNDLYVVQVYTKENNGNLSPFASGVFDDMSLCKLNLKKGSSYSVLICMVRDAKNYLGKNFSLTNNGISNYYTDNTNSYNSLGNYTNSGSNNNRVNTTTGPYHLSAARESTYGDYYE